VVVSDAASLTYSIESTKLTSRGVVGDLGERLEGELAEEEVAEVRGSESVRTCLEGEAFVCDPTPARLRCGAVGVACACSAERGAAPGLLVGVRRGDCGAGVPCVNCSSAEEASAVELPLVLVMVFATRGSFVEEPYSGMGRVCGELPAGELPPLPLLSLVLCTRKVGVGARGRAGILS
jgi:hypothetical protein